jgi:hypothetical protein
MTNIRRVSIVTCRVGFDWANDGSNIGTGTSIHWTNCFVNGAVGTGLDEATGFRIYGLHYSNITACGVDGVESAGGVAAYSYSFISCQGISMSGCGTERTKGSHIRSSGSSLSISSFDGRFEAQGKTFTGQVALIDVSASSVTLLNCVWSTITSPGNIYNILTRDGASLVNIGSTLPTGGDTFNSFSSGSSITQTVAGVSTLQTAFGSVFTYRPIECGQVSFAAATTASVVFTNPQPSAAYFVAISANANKTFWITAKTITGFTVNASSTSSDAVDWMVVR